MVQIIHPMLPCLHSLVQTSPIFPSFCVRVVSHSSNFIIVDMDYVSVIIFEFCILLYLYCNANLIACAHISLSLLKRWCSTRHGLLNYNGDLFLHSSFLQFQVLTLLTFLFSFLPTTPFQVCRINSTQQ